MENVCCEYEALEVGTFELAESPVWDHGKKNLYWVNMPAGDIHRYSFLTNRHDFFNTGTMVGCVALNNEGRLIAAIKTGFAFIDMDEHHIGMIRDIVSDPDIRFNDGKCDPAGRFWAGTMSMSGRSASGALYCLHTDGTVERKLDGIGCSNGLAWSPDNRIMYYIDTLKKCVTAFDYDIKTAAIGNEKVVVDFTNDSFLPDGMTIDREGMLWIALWGGAQVARYNPGNGACLGRIKLPASQITSCTFGGDDPEQLFVTSAASGLERHADNKDGAVFKINNPGCFF